MEIRRALGLALGLSCATSLFACNASHEEGVAISSDELRELRADEILGQIGYTDTRRSIDAPAGAYRAFSFKGTIGDTIDGWIRSTNGDARAWLLDANFKTLAENDDGNAAEDGPPIADARLKFTLRKSGTHYIAFREKSGHAATFDVSLTRTGSSDADPRFPAWLEGHLEFATNGQRALSHVSASRRVLNPRYPTCEAVSLTLYRDVNVRLVDESGLRALVELASFGGTQDRDELLEFLACQTFGEPNETTSLAACPAQKRPYTFLVPLVADTDAEVLGGSLTSTIDDGSVSVSVKIAASKEYPGRHEATVELSALQKNVYFEECGRARFAAQFFAHPDSR